MAVIDANIGVWAILPTVAAVDVHAFLDDPSRRGEPLLAPALWRAECVSVVRAYVFAGILTDDEGRRAIDLLMDVDLTLAPLDADLCHSAFAWARRLGQRRAYDGFYIALAERLGVRLWTADHRLVNAARALRLDWVEWAGQPSSSP